MGGMEYDEAAAERLEAVYRTADVVAQRDDTLARLALRPGERVLDVGSGPGFLAAEMATAVGPNGRVRGVDLSAQMVRRAASRTGCGWIDFRVGDATALDEPDGSWDVAVSTQVAEYVPDTTAFCAELFRVLAPGGRALVVATDWDGIVWHTEDPERMARVMTAFRAHCADPNLPRRLAALMRGAGFADVRASAFPLVTTDWQRPTYCQGMMSFVKGFCEGRGLVPAEELDAWIDEQARLAADGRLFFATVRFVFEGRRPG